MAESLQQKFQAQYHSLDEFADNIHNYFHSF